MMTILLVLVVLQGEAHTFAVATDSPAQCIVLESSAATWLPQVIGRKPEYFAAKCADVKPFLTAV